MEMTPLPAARGPDRAAKPAAATAALARVTPRAAALSVLVFWIAYYVSVSARSAIMRATGWEHYLGNRALVALAGMSFTWALYLALRRFDGRRLAVRVAAVILFCVPVSLAYAAVNYVALYVYDPLPDSLKDRTRRPKTPLQVVGHDSIHWYFFILSWGAFYLALSYAAQVKASEQEAARLRAAARDAELRALRYQVNPHFLFNTLNSISSLVMTGRAGQAERMILNLSRFFRTSLAAEPTEDVRLEEEVALQRLYLDIEAVRFPDRLRAEFTIEPGLEAACVPGMILQPLIENAVKHGVSPAKRPVSVRIAARRDGGRLRIDVGDDGGGTSCSGTGVGLRNIADRLLVRFGGEASLDYGPVAGGGFAATLTMPLVLRGC